MFDRLQPITQNYVCKGITWKKHNVTYEQVVEENKCIKEGSEEIWSFVEYILQKSVEKGYLAKNQPPREGGNKSKLYWKAIIAMHAGTCFPGIVLYLFVSLFYVYTGALRKLFFFPQ